MYVRWRKERPDSKGVIIVVLLQWEGGGGDSQHKTAHMLEYPPMYVHRGRKNETERVRS